MHGRVIQGFFVGGEMRAMPGVLRGTSTGPIAPLGPPPPAHQARAGAAVQRAVPGRPAPVARPGPPPAAFASAVAQPRIGHSVQAHGAKGNFEVDPARLGLARGGGSPLPPTVQAKMEAAFGADFSAVRVHVGPQAARIGAIAFTTGNDIYFAPGRYQPESLQGQQLLGHELAHVLQQRQGRVRSNGGGVAVVQDRALENEADRLGMRAAMSRAPAAVAQRAATGPIQRQVVLQRMETFYCDQCDFFSASAQGVAVHKGRKHRKRKVEEIVEKKVNDEDEMSEWDYESLDEGEEDDAFRTSRGGNQRKLYQKRGSLKKKFHSSEGLSEAVGLIGGGNAPKANTHLLVSGKRPPKGRRKRVMAHSSTINAMRAMTLRYKGTNMPAVQNIVGKKKHVHTEMYVIWVITRGDKNKIDGCMRGMKLVVDKPICKKCVPYVRRAQPILVDDGIKNLNSDRGRDDWDDWKNPFDMKGLELPENPFL